MKKDYYKILCIPHTATTNDIKKAYRRLVHKYHPDIAGNTPDNIEKFKEITEAYETLSSPEKRQRYDSIMKLYDYADGGEGVNDRVNRGSASSKKEDNKTQSGRASDNKTSGNKSKEDKKDDIPKEPKRKNENTYSRMREEAKRVHTENIFSTFIQGIVNAAKPKQKKYVPPKIDGKDITTEVTLSVNEAINGTERIVNILHMETCEKCRGRKFINGALCPSCGGKGEKSKYKKLTVKIPPQVKHNTKIRVEGEGNKGYNGGKRGDLYLVVKIENNTELQYDGLNILRTVSIEPYEAVLGGHITFEMNGENIRMKLMPNTYNGQRYRISEQGVEKDGKKGDLIITIKIDIRKNLSIEEIELYEKLKLVAKRNIREPQD